MDDGVTVTLDGVRKVEKVEVGYASKSKKVDVKRLKKELWAELLSRKSASGDADPLVSFRDVMEEMEGSQKQEDVSLAYYFICVLHLANENGLRFHGEDNLEDFKVEWEEGEVGY